MYAVELETDVVNPYIYIPNYEKFQSKHIKVVLMAETEEPLPKPKYKFDDLIGKLEWQGDALAVQKGLR